MWPGWWAVERWVELDSPLFAPGAVLRPAGGALLVGLGLLMARWRPASPWTVGALALAAGIATPPLYLRATTPPPPPRAERPRRARALRTSSSSCSTRLRAASLSAYGYGRATSPEFDALAAEGALFGDATSPSTWSLPSHASLFTGVYPSSHGAHGEHRFLDERYPTLAQVLANHGYETLCFTSNAWISDGLGLTRGFDFQDASWRSGGGAARGFSFIYRLLYRVGLLAGDKGGGVVASHFEAWARERPEDARPAFVFLK